MEALRDLYGIVTQTSSDDKGYEKAQYDFYAQGASMSQVESKCNSPTFSEIQATQSGCKLSRSSVTVCIRLDRLLGPTFIIVHA